MGKSSDSTIHQAAPSLCRVHCCLYSPEAWPSIGSGLPSQSTVASGLTKDESQRRSRMCTEQVAAVEPTQLLSLLPTQSRGLC